MNEKLKSFARELRRNQTDAEKIMWRKLRAKRLQSLKFRRQQPIGKFIVDFVCFEKKLIIELDGSQHSENKELDESRDDWLLTQGYTVVRFWNNDVLKNIDGVMHSIQSIIQSPSPAPPIKGGE